jgi:hypothetical protein
LNKENGTAPKRHSTVLFLEVVYSTAARLVLAASAAAGLATSLALIARAALIVLTAAV